MKKKYIHFFAIGTLSLICLIVFHQLLFSGEVINATDILTQQYFWNVFTKDNLFQDPSFRTWMPYVNAGTPFGGGLNLLFRPVAFLTLLLLPVHIALNYEVVLYLLLMGIFMYMYMRELEVSPWSAFLASLFLMLNGEIVSLVNAGHVNKLGTIALTPLVFWALERALTRKTLTSFLIAGIALAVQFWEGHIQISFYVCIGVGLYFLIRVGLIFSKERNIRQLSRLTVFALLMVVIFLLLSAVDFLPWISFAQVSERAQGVSYEFATSWSMPPEELLSYVIPGFFGLRRLNYGDDENIIPYWGRMPFTQTGRYFGLLPLLLLLLALCFARSKHVLTLGILAVVILLLGMGRYFPFYKFLYAYAPGFNKFRVPQMILFLFAFATSGLAGFGAEWLFRDWSKIKETRLRVFLLIGIAVLMLSGLIVALFPHFEASLHSTFEEAFFRKGADSEIAAGRLQNIYEGFTQFTLLWGAALFVLGLRLSPKISKTWVFLALTLVYLIDIGLFNEKYLDTIPLEGSHYISENDTIRYCKENPGFYRILPSTSEPITYNISNKYVYHKLFNISGYEAVGVQYYNEYLQQMIFGSSLIDLLNIKYLILPKNITLDSGEAVKVGQSVGPYKVVMNSDAVLLENPNYLPRVFPVHQAYVETEREKILPALLQASFNPRESVILEEELPQPQQHVLASEGERIESSSQSTAEITHYLNRTIDVKATMAEDGFLVLSEKFYPGWQAYVDGEDTKIYKANYTLQAIFLPKGEHQVRFLFKPRQFYLGLSITVLTMLGLLGAVVFRKLMSTRKTGDGIREG